MSSNLTTDFRKELNKLNFTVDAGLLSKNAPPIPTSANGTQPKPRSSSRSSTSSVKEKVKLNDDVWKEVLKVHEEVEELVPLNKQEELEEKLDSLYKECFLNKKPKEKVTTAISAQTKKLENEKKKIKEVFDALQKSLGKPVPKTTFEFPTVLKDSNDAILHVKLLDSEINLQDKKALQFIFETGKFFLEVKRIARKHFGKKKFFPFLQEECKVNWSQSYTYVFTGYYELASKYPRLLDAPVSRNFLTANLKWIRKGFRECEKKQSFWNFESDEYDEIEDYVDEEMETDGSNGASGSA